jgi:membrane-associated phospholipid phosphatase
VIRAFTRKGGPDPGAGEAPVGPDGLARDSASETAGLADLPPITPSPGPASRRAAAAVAVAAGAAFVLVTAWVVRRGAAVPALDREIHGWVVAHRGPGGVAVARAARWAGTTEVILPALIAVGAAAGRGRDLGARLGSGFLLCLVASTGIYAEIWVNHAIGRPRPPAADWAGAAGGASFPSGHTTAATLFALSCAWAVAARLPPGWPRRAAWAGGAAYAVTVGWSRVWLGVHWPTDVAGGWLFGTAWLAACVAAITLSRRRPQPSEALSPEALSPEALPPAGGVSGQSRPRRRSRRGRPSGS